MRILHTSDWHLGRSFHRVGLLDAQAAFLDHVVATVVEEKVDLVVVSGDVYDRALPPVEAVSLADDAFARLAATGTRVVVTSGNHDSAIRLGANSRLADAAGVHLRTRTQDVATPVLLEDRYGSVAVYGLPYLEPDAVRQEWSLPERTHAAALGAATDRVRQDLGSRPGARSVVMAHAFVAGSSTAETPTPSDSERDISVGGLQIAPTSLFTGFDYVALGHLHGRHTLAEQVRYSGSPLAYSFSEANHTKGSWLIELGPAGVERADVVEAPTHRALATVTGTLDALLTDPALAYAEDAFVQAIVTDTLRPRHTMERLRQRFPHALLLDFAPESAAPTARTPVVPRVTSSVTDFDVTLGFVADVRAQSATTEEELLLQLACDSCRINDEAKEIAL
ncbi:MAG: exonuclease subunit SbcD [Nocardioidaceae bacterium]